MSILITLGHNSSAIQASDTVESGYEEERLTRIKSDSSFPRKALDKLECNKKQPLFVSHWYDNFNFYKIKNQHIQKHFDYDYIKSLDSEIHTLDADFTHHDAHAMSAMAFCKSQLPAASEALNDGAIIFVSDGFGNSQEVFSIYRFNSWKKPTLICRVYDYANSLGLLYQYATSYVGMKEFEDEYKFLGYESLIEEYFDKDKVSRIEDGAQKYIDNWLEHFRTSRPFRPDLLYINETYLAEVKDKFYILFDNLVNNFFILDSTQKRVLIGYYIQFIIEGIHKRLIEIFDVKNLLLAGGLYYNVKLNNTILKSIKGQFCVMPLAGDQGTALGLYFNHNQNFKLDNLVFGRRPIDNINEETTDKIVSKLLKDEIVQVVCGNMEFGPRALCNTSTLCLATKENVDIVNILNGRNTVMPMAPVMLEKNLEYFFNKDQYGRVIGSDRYMIITYDYIRQPDFLTLGAAHKYPRADLYSGRPQVIDNPNSYIYKVLKELDIYGIKLIINTSFNAHGTPIVYSEADALKDWVYQNSNIGKLEKSKSLNLFIGNELYV